MSGFVGSSLLEDGRSGNGDSDSWDGSEMEYKVDPSLVKTEIEEEDSQQYEDPLSGCSLEDYEDDDGSTARANDGNNVEEAVTSKRKPQRDRKTNVDWNVDAEDTTGTAPRIKPEPKEAPPKKKRRKKTTVIRKRRSKRKHVAELSPEELELTRRKWKEDRRRLRLKNLTEVEREIQIASWNKRDEKKMERALKAEVQEKPEKKQKSNLKDEQLQKGPMNVEEMDESELPKEIRQKLTKERASLRHLERIQLRRDLMTDEEREAERQKNYFRHQARLARRTLEERAEFRRRQCELARERNIKKYATLEEIEQRREKKRQWYKDLTPEEKAKHLEKMREYRRTKIERLQQTPEQFAKWREKKLAKQQELDTLYKKVKKGTITEEEREQLLERIKRGRGGALGEMTPEERIERWSRSQGNNKEIKSNYPVSYIPRRKMLELGKSYAEMLSEKETPEERTQRLMQRRIEDAKFRAKKKLKDMGATPEEIKRRLIEVEKTYVGSAKPIEPFIPRKSKYRKGISAVPTQGSADPEPSSSSSALVSENPSRGRGRGRPQKNTKSKNPIPIPGTSSVVDDKQETGESRPGPSQPHPFLIHHNQQQQPYPYQTVGHLSSQQLQPSFMHPLNPADFRDTCGSSMSSSHLIFNASCGDVDYSKFTQERNFSQAQDHSSSASFEPEEPMMSPASPVHSYGGVPSPQQHEDELNNEVQTELPNLRPFPTTYPETQTRESLPNYWAEKPITSRSVNPCHNIPKTTERSTDRGYFEAGRIRGPQKNRVVKEKRDRICDECGVAFSRNTLYNHKKFYHNPHFKDYRCLICGEEFARIRDWYHQHFRVVHPEYQTKRVTKKDLKQRLDEEKKKRRRPIDKPHICSQCGNSYAHLGNLQHHEKVSHGEIRFKCDFCEKEFRSKQFRDKHHFKEHNHTTIKCERCGAYFGSSAELREHLKNDHVNSHHPCDFCEAVQISEIGMKTHLNYCRKVPKERLRELRKKWEEEGAPEVHTVIIGCEFCSASKVSVDSLRTHYRDIHGLTVKEDPHKCTQCAKTFKTRGFFIAHMAGLHEVPMKECLDMARPYNVQNKEELKVLNEGLARKPKSTRKPRKVKPIKIKMQKPLIDGKRGRGRPRKAMKEEDPSDSDESVEEKCDGMPEGLADFDDIPPPTKRTRRVTAVKAQKRIRIVQKEFNEDDNEDSDASEGTESDISKIIKQEVETDDKLNADCFVKLEKYLEGYENV